MTKYRFVATNFCPRHKFWGRLYHLHKTKVQHNINYTKKNFFSNNIHNRVVAVLPLTTTTTITTTTTTTTTGKRPLTASTEISSSQQHQQAVTWFQSPIWEKEFKKDIFSTTQRKQQTLIAWKNCAKYKQRTPSSSTVCKEHIQN